MRALLSGILGHMGREVLALSGCRGVEIAAGVDLAAFGECPIPVAADFDCAETDVDCVMDFSHHAATKALTDFCVKNRLPLVLATTGQTDEEREMIFAAAEKIPLFFAANYSLGIALLAETAKKIAAAMPEAELEIVEMHHDRKIDAPSGTALTLAEALREVRPHATVVTGRSGHGKRAENEIGIQSVRLGNIVGVHEILIGTASETITLKHEAHSRALFAEGAYAAVAYLAGKPAGLYTMQDLI